MGRDVEMNCCVSGHHINHRNCRKYEQRFGQGAPPKPPSPNHPDAALRAIHRAVRRRPAVRRAQAEGSRTRREAGGLRRGGRGSALLAGREQRLALRQGKRLDHAGVTHEILDIKDALRITRKQTNGLSGSGRVLADLSGRTHIVDVRRGAVVADVLRHDHVERGAGRQIDRRARAVEADPRVAAGRAKVVAGDRVGARANGHRQSVPDVQRLLGVVRARVLPCVLLYARDQVS